MYVYNHPKRGSLAVKAVATMVSSAFLLCFLFILPSSGLSFDIVSDVGFLSGFVSVFCAPAIALFFLDSKLTNVFRAFHALVYFVLPNGLLFAAWYLNIQVNSNGQAVGVPTIFEYLLYQFGVAYISAGLFFVYFHLKYCLDAEILRLEAAKQSFKAQVKSFTMHEQCPNNMADHLKEVIVPYVEKLEDIDEVDEITEMLSKYESGWDMHEPLFNRPYSS